jgi:Rrf2 family protein
MQLTRGTEYAIRALVYLSMRQSEDPILLAEIAEGIGAPPNYLSNIFQILSRLELVRSHRGAKRGYSLAKDPEQISLRDIVEGIEGPISVSSCNVDKSWCEYDGDCAMFEVWDDLQNTITAKLEKAKLSKLVGACFLHEVTSRKKKRK